MIKSPKNIKQTLSNTISTMAQSIDTFVQTPGKDFTRTRMLSFVDTISFTLTMTDSALRDEMLKYFNDNHTITPTSSAVIQQRDKLLPKAFQHLFKTFTNACVQPKLYKGFQLFAVDGSVLNIPHNPNDSQTYIQCSKDAKGFNQLHLNGFYDISNKLFIDACVQPCREKNERGALIEMIKQSDLSNNSIVIVDRGYESYNLVAHLDKKDWKYILRIKEKTSRSIASTLNLPDSDEFDVTRTLTLTRKQTKEVKANPNKYKFLPNNAKFDFLDEETLYYDLTFRVIRIKIGEDKYETILTNLDPKLFCKKDIKELYGSRWRIETAFRELKHIIGLIRFHSKKMSFILQEIYAKLTMYNFSMLITMSVTIPKKDRQYEYQVNFTAAIKICKRFLKEKDKKKAERMDVEGSIRKEILPIRPGRQAPRNPTSSRFTGFNYSR